MSAVNVKTVGLLSELPFVRVPAQANYYVLHGARDKLCIDRVSPADAVLSNTLLQVEVCSVSRRWWFFARREPVLN